MPGRNCRDCGARIQFIEREGRWIPVEPGTEDRHRCEIDVVCQSCGETFRGGSWMKQCPKCYKGGRSASQEPASEPRAKEKLEPVSDDDVPF
jgi:hypothetical protein